MVLGCFLKCIFMFNCVHVSVCVCIWRPAEGIGSLVMELVIGSVSCLTWVLGTKSTSSGAAVALNCYSVSPALVWSFYLQLGYVLWG